MSPERTHSEAETLDEAGSRQDVGKQPSAPRDYVRTPESDNHVLLPYEELFSVCAKYEGDQYYVGEAIGQKRLTNAHMRFPIPDTERIIALIDTSMSERQGRTRLMRRGNLLAQRLGCPGQDIQDFSVVGRICVGLY